MDLAWRNDENRLMLRLDGCCVPHEPIMMRRRIFKVLEREMKAISMKGKTCGNLMCGTHSACSERRSHRCTCQWTNRNSVSLSPKGVGIQRTLISHRGSISWLRSWTRQAVSSLTGASHRRTHERRFTTKRRSTNGTISRRMKHKQRIIVIQQYNWWWSRRRTAGRFFRHGHDFASHLSCDCILLFFAL